MPQRALRPDSRCIEVSCSYSQGLSMTLLSMGTYTSAHIGQDLPACSAERDRLVLLQERHAPLHCAREEWMRVLDGHVELESREYNFLDIEDLFHQQLKVLETEKQREGYASA